MKKEIKREEGYYWVKKYNSWFVANYRSGVFIAPDDFEFLDSELQ